MREERGRNFGEKKKGRTLGGWGWGGAVQTSGYLHHLRVIEPLAENSLNQGEDLLQDDHHLQTRSKQESDKSQNKSE